MSFQQARNQLDAAYGRGEIDRATWQSERDALEYAYGESKSAQDDRRVVA